MIESMVIIKPHAVSVSHRILRYIDVKLQNSGKREITVAVEAVPEEVIREHYLPHAGKPFYKNLVRQFAGNPVVLGLYQGDDSKLIGAIREICGPTAPEQARMVGNNIRAVFTYDSLSKAIEEDRAVDNVIHSPDSVEEARREIQVWKQFLKR